MNSFIHYYMKKCFKGALYPLRLFPIKKNRVFLMNDLAYNYSDNQKVIAQYLNEHEKGKYEIIFSVSKSGMAIFPKDIDVKPVLFNSFKYFYYAATSAVCITNSGGFSYIPIRKKQRVINTWHGGGAYKKCGIYMYEDTKLFRKDLELSSKITTDFLSTCKRFTEVVSESMLVPIDKFREVGMPRNDMLINIDETRREKIKAKLGLLKDEKLILFAPTYRKPDDNYFNESVAISYGIDTVRATKAFEKRFGGKWRFAYRLHPCIVNRDVFTDKNAMDLTDYDDMQELLLAADIMINDFSSSMWDFMLTGRPSFLFAVDLQHYVETTQVYTPVASWPFPVATDNDMLEQNILNFDEEKYKADCARHYSELGGCESGKATQYVCSLIDETCNKKKVN